MPSRLIHLKVDPSDAVPMYRQIVDQVAGQIAAGSLGSGDELPSVRVLSTQYLIHPSVVVRAYLDLEHSGLVIKKRGLGTFVAPGVRRMTAAQRREAAGKLLEEALERGLELGLTAEELSREAERRLETLIAARG